MLFLSPQVYSLRSVSPLKGRRGQVQAGSVSRAAAKHSEESETYCEGSVPADSSVHTPEVTEILMDPLSCLGENTHSSLYGLDVIDGFCSA